MLTPTSSPNYESLSQLAANWIEARVSERPGALLCLAAGVTPRRTYKILADRGANSLGMFERCRFLKLDEWGGLPTNSAGTCEHQLRSELIEPLKATARYAGFQSDAADRQAECDRIANWLRKNGPIDVCVLGLGVNGHVGFNEPAKSLQAHAHIAQLSEASLGHSMVHSTTRQPTYGITLGMADILQAREIVLLASGPSKRGPIKRLLSGEISTEFPASLLHLHPRVTFLCDVDAYGEGGEA